MISTLFQNTPSPSFHAIVKAAIQISLCQYEWPLLKLFYANIFPTGICPLALLLIYPSIQPIPSAFLFHLLKFHMTRAAAPAPGPAPHPGPKRGCCCLRRYLSHREKPHTQKKLTEETFLMIDFFFSPHSAPLPLLSSPTFVSTNKRARVRASPRPAIGEKEPWGLRGGKMRV